MGTWTTGLCGCMEDCSSCCCALWCPCIVVGRNAEIVTDGFTDFSTASCLWFLIEILVGMGCLYSCGFRQKLRQKYMLPAKPCGDCCVHFFCFYCSICQEYRELKNRGWEPSLGYSGNTRRFMAAGKVPPTGQRMAR
ncbi:hypothetical protein CLOM_g7643 [Closterium sp. NIES-68]|nr:hypothetical protein CLOM_g7643 [Closterium sp. NIES-68]GJP65853.1 hypothetical protein CLOP_g22761 [Closterium sp. NIES-67]